MDYMTLKEASKNQVISSRQVNYYCVDRRIPGCENNRCLVDPQEGRKDTGWQLKQGRAIK